MDIETISGALWKVVEELFPSALIAAGALWLFRNWFVERIKGEIASDYARKLEAQKDEYAHRLETHKAELRARYDADLEQVRADIAQVRAMESAANAAYASVQSAVMERRLKAIETVWHAVIELEEFVGRQLGHLDMFPPIEFARVRKDPVFIAELKKVGSQEFVSEIHTLSRHPESARPFVGEVLWAYFDWYRAFLGRVATRFFLAASLDWPHWSEDPKTREMLYALFSHEELSPALQQTKSRLAAVSGILKSKVLEAISQTISGQESTSASLEQARRIASLVAEMREVGDAGAELALRQLQRQGA